MATTMLDIFDSFSFCMSPDVPPVKVGVLTGDFKF